MVRCLCAKEALSQWFLREADVNCYFCRQESGLLPQQEGLSWGSVYHILLLSSTPPIRPLPALQCAANHLILMATSQLHVQLPSRLFPPSPW